MLGLPWEAWGETDVLLAMARREVESGRCPCGCGHDSHLTTDPATEGRWEPTVTECYARAALEEYQERHKDDLPAGALVGVRLLAEGEEAKDSLKYDPERARREYAEHKERFGLA